MFLYGAGGIGVVALDVLQERGVGVDCVIDDHAAFAELLGVPVVASLEAARARFGAQPEGLICIGSNARRRELAESLPVRYASAVSGTAVVARSATIGPGTMVFHRTVVQARARVGRHVILNTAAGIDHDCTIGDFVHVGPNCALCGHVTLEDGVDVGAGATLIPGVRVGRDTVIGAGTVVLHDLPARCVAVGAPARVIRTF